MMYLLLSLFAATAIVLPNTKDTLLVHETVPSFYSAPGCVEEEYYLVSGRDTSLFSCIVTIDDRKVFTLKVECENRRKLSHTEETDSSPLSQEISSVAYTPIPFEQEIRVLETILNDVYERYKMTDKVNVILDIGDFGDASVRINEAYREALRFGKDEYKTLRQIVEESDLYYRINSIFSKYSKTIADIELEEICFIHRNEFLNTNKVVVEKRIPKQMVSCIAYFSIISEDSSVINF